MAHYNEVQYHREHGTFLTNMIASLIAAAGGLLVLLLAVRFILSAGAVDRLTPIASFIYSASYPFVSPFFALFQQPIGGVERIEYQTLIAMAFWAVVTWIITGLITFTDED